MLKVERADDRYKHRWRLGLANFVLHPSSPLHILLLLASMASCLSAIALGATASAVGGAAERFGRAAAEWGWAAAKRMWNWMRRHKVLSLILLLIALVVALTFALIGVCLEIKVNNSEIETLRGQPEAPLLGIQRVDMQMQGEQAQVDVTMYPVLRAEGFDYIFSQVEAKAKCGSEDWKIHTIDRTLAQGRERKMWKASFYFDDLPLPPLSDAAPTTNATSLTVDFNLSSQLEWRTKDERLTGHMAFQAVCRLDLNSPSQVLEKVCLDS